MTANALEELFPTGQDDDLDLSGDHIEDVKHTLHAPVIREHESIIEDHSRGVALLHKHLGKGEANQHRNLLLSPHAEVVEGLFIAAVPDHPDDVQVLIDSDV